MPESLRTPRALREAHALDRADARHEVARRILGDDARLHGPTARLRRRVAEREFLTFCDTQLLGHEIETRDHLGHRMFDLEPRVDLEEVETASARRG
jgi:hypothetical protein